MTWRSLPNFNVYSRYLAPPTASGASTLTIQSTYECLPCFHDLFTRGFKLSKGRVKTSEVASILSVDTLSLPYRYYVLSDTVKY